MRYHKFKEHQITRTCKENFDKYSKYRPFLEEDFKGRCCYCNMSSELLTISYHVEHFIPIKVFEGKRDSLLTDYDNLMWACPKCNLSKGDKYEGDFQNSSRIENELFYNPVTVDYNDIFFRNEIGGIDSDDEKGREMIKLLKLYRPIHNLAWLIERLEKLAFNLDLAAKKETDLERRELLDVAAGKVALELAKKAKLFRAAYNGKKFIESEYNK
ncbi:MAG: HNH endonuclease [Lachnospiraceae bacterium]|nr:HNH endonuclease [Lachnospiraceae bacterium]